MCSNIVSLPEKLLGVVGDLLVAGDNNLTLGLLVLVVGGCLVGYRYEEWDGHGHGLQPF